MDMYVGGRWQSAAEWIDVVAPRTLEGQQREELPQYDPIEGVTDLCAEIRKGDRVARTEPV